MNLYCKPGAYKKCCVTISNCMVTPCNNFNWYSVNLILHTYFVQLDFIKPYCIYNRRSPLNWLLHCSLWPYHQIAHHHQIGHRITDHHPIGHCIAALIISHITIAVLIASRLIYCSFDHITYYHCCFDCIAANLLQFWLYCRTISHQRHGITIEFWY
jgi:hypothetical protein